MINLNEKYKKLEQLLKACGKVVIAYSGGVDSTFLLKAAIDTLGSENVLACIGISASLSKSQYAQAIECAKLIGANIEEIKIDELSDEQYIANKADRCFHCKSHLYTLLLEIAKNKGLDKVVCGSNFDDKDDFRPGNHAAKLLEIGCPLMEAEFTKDDIRQKSREFSLPTADVPASPCLASRVNYGLKITEQRLAQVEQSEDFLRSLGLIEFRVRHHNEVARIEVKTDDITKVTTDPNKTAIVEKLKSIGFKFVAIDLQGFRSGSLNETLSDAQKQEYT